MSKLKAHPYADLFPMMTSLELEALTADIKENGLHHPVVLYHGEILDGRNRLLACERAGVEPTFNSYDGDDPGALALALSMNGPRRNLTAAQRAIVAARALSETFMFTWPACSV
jgi:ParB-like chromosome segregation protein Spo0J